MFLPKQLLLFVLTLGLLCASALTRADALGGYPDGESYDYYGRYNPQTPAERSGFSTLTCSGASYTIYSAKDGSIWLFNGTGMSMTVVPTSNNFAQPVCADAVGPVFTFAYSALPNRTRDNTDHTPFNWLTGVYPYLYGAHVTP